DTRGLAKKSLLETYRAEQRKNQQGVEEAREANPNTFLAGELGGSLYGAGKFAKTKAGKGVGQYLRTGNLPSRIAKGAAVGGASSGLYGAGTASPGETIENAVSSVPAGAAVGGAIPALGAAFRKI